MRSGWVYVCVSGEVARVGDWGPASVSTTKTLPFPSVHSLRSSFSNTTWYAVCHVCCSVKRCILGINWFRSSCDTLCMPSQVPYGTTLLVALVQRYWCNVTGGATLLVQRYWWRNVTGDAVTSIIWRNGTGTSGQPAVFYTRFA